VSYTLTPLYATPGLATALSAGPASFVAQVAAPPRPTRIREVRPVRTFQPDEKRVARIRVVESFHRFDALA